MLVQIYGITSPEDAAIVNALAPDNVGLVLREGFQTWDGVNLCADTVEEAAEHADAGLSRIGNADQLSFAFLRHSGLRL